MPSAGWEPVRIKAELRARHIKISDIARQLSITPAAVQQCINRTYVHYKGRRVRRAIAEHLDVPVQEIWPDEAPKHESA